MSERRALTEAASKAALGPDLPLPREAITTTVAEAVAFAESIGGAVVAKASGVAHKSDAGLVRLGLDPAGVAACWDALAAAGDGTVLIAEMISGELELIVGGLRDPQFGPVVTIGIGGITAEVTADIATLLAPPEPGEVAAAVASLRSAALFEGFRGRAPVDIELLTTIVHCVSDVLVHDESVVEIDCNPVLISEGRPIVADALVVRLAASADQAAET